MKNTFKILLATFVASSFIYASSFEYATLYKDQKLMGAGGASVAHGGNIGSLMSNPAGLSKIPQKYGWEITAFGLNIEASKDFKDFYDEFEDIDDDLSSNEKTAEVLKILEKNLGENFHIGLTMPFASVAKSFEKYSFGVMPLVGTQLNLMPHRGNGVDGLLEANGIAYGGIALGLSRTLDDLDIPDLVADINVGAGLKIFKYKTLDKALTTAEIVDNKDEPGDYFEEISSEGTSIALDIGVQADVYKGVNAGFSLMNIGGIGDSKGVEIPMTANIGAAYVLDIADRFYFNKVTFSSDFVDMFYAHDDDSFIKRTRFGADASIIEHPYGGINAQLGLYQGSPTFGISLRAFALNLGYTYYKEQTGPNTGDRDDARHMFSYSIAW